MLLRIAWRISALIVGICALLGSSIARARAEDPAPGGDLAAYDARITAEDRAHWAFTPVKRPELPAVKAASWVRNPIDRFVLAQLEEKGWAPSAPAEPRALLRRLYFDVIGLPPTPAEQEALLKDPSPEAFDRLVDDLLARPSYGERWARHWLDVVRFAESNGYERDATKPSAWRFRDYVIRAFNSDKPYDRFLIEQLAGDELPAATAETLIATGFARLGPWDDEPADPEQDRFDQLDDIAATTSEVFLGLTLACARCHNHKFEPLTMHDYYRMVAVFNPLDRPRAGRMELDLPVGNRAQLAELAERDRRIEGLKKEFDQLRATLRREHLEKGNSQLPAPAVAAFLAEPSKRTGDQNALVTQHESALEGELAVALPVESKQRLSALEAEIRWLREQTPDLARGYFCQERSGEPPATHILLRGQATRPGTQVEPGVPAVLVRAQPSFSRPASGTSTSLRRLTLAKWLASPENPLTARVIVNRIWQFHFGAGIVRTSSDFGTMGDPPTHPELLDWLADWFVHDGGYSFKKLHKLILASNSYRMSKAWRAPCAEADPEDRLLWRVPYRRLEVEAIRDAMLAASGQLNPRMYGQSMYPEVPKEAIDAHPDAATVWPPLDELDSSRRTVYTFIKRSMVVPMIEVLDFCDTTRSSARRNVTSVAPQALTLLNGAFVNRQARHFATRLEKEAPACPTAQVEQAYLLALCRPPSPSERSAMQRFLDREAESQMLEAAMSLNPIDAKMARHRALEQMARVIFNLNEFVYTD